MMDLTTLTNAGFDEQSYAKANPDVPHGEWGAHFIRHGAAERRRFDIDINAEALRDSMPVDQLAGLCHAFIHTLGDRLCTDIETYWPIIARFMELGAKPILIIGDSHSVMYRWTPLFSTGWILPIALVLTGGSARGLMNENSRTGYGKILKTFNNRITALNSGKPLPIILNFGQVDVEFVYMFKRINIREVQFSPTSFNSFCEIVIERYSRYIDDLKVSNQKIGIASIFPPTLSDACLEDGYVNGHIAALESSKDLEMLRAGVRSLQIPTLEERTVLHRLFNQKLFNRVSASGDIELVDDFTGFIGDDGVVDPIFTTRSRGTDHHLDFEYTRLPMDTVIRKFAA